MRVKIISDGTPRGTKVTNVETGEPIENVIAIEWQQDSGNFGSCVLRVLAPEVELIVEAIEEQVTKWQTQTQN